MCEQASGWWSVGEGVSFFRTNTVRRMHEDIEFKHIIKKLQKCKDIGMA